MSGRKRGRPSKKLQLEETIPSVMEDEEKSILFDLEEAVAPALPEATIRKKRGRPPKNRLPLDPAITKTPNSDNEVEEKFASIEVDAGKMQRRGKRKSGSRPANPIKNEPADSEEVEQTMQCWIVEQTPCDGDRSNQDTLEEPTIACDQLIENDTLLEIPKRKRGRPPKSSHTSGTKAKTIRQQKKQWESPSDEPTTTDEESDKGSYEWADIKKTRTSKSLRVKNRKAAADKAKRTKDYESKSEDEVKEDESAYSEEEHTAPNGLKLIQCLVCGEKMHKIHQLRQHMQLHGQGEDMDDKTLENAPIYEYLNPHSRKIDTPVIRDFLVKEIKAQRSSQCYVIYTQSELELHISDSETDSEAEQQPIEGAVTASSNKLIPRNIYQCALCGSGDGIFNRRYEALHHQRRVHTDQQSSYPFKCFVCGRAYVSLQLLVHHMKTRCENDEQPFPLLERFWRHLARANLELMENFSQARRAVRVPRPANVQRDFECEVCAKRFMRYEHLARHKLIHVPEEQKIRCPHCPGRTFSRKDNLKLHMKVHMDESERSQLQQREILCADCGLSFKRLSNYVIHTRRHHTGEKPYVCNFCGKRFVCSTDLNSHKLTHTNERNFHCEFCGKRFGRSGMLTKHVSTAHGVKRPRAELVYGFKKQQCTNVSEENEVENDSTPNDSEAEDDGAVSGLTISLLTTA